jgi:hypothetical protein
MIAATTDNFCTNQKCVTITLQGDVKNATKLRRFVGKVKSKLDEKFSIEICRSPDRARLLKNDLIFAM